MSYYLMHHGIKGQSWGVTNGPPYPLDAEDHNSSEKKKGTSGWTKEAKKEAKKDLKKAKNKYNVAVNTYNVKTNYGNKYVPGAYKELKKEQQSYNISKQKYDDKKSELKSKDQKYISERQKKYEQEYLDKGFTKDEARTQAYKKVQTQKAIAAVAGVTIAASAAYIAYKQYDKYADKVIKAGVGIQNISNTDNVLGRGSQHIYGAINSSDKLKYRGLYGNDIARSNQKVFNATIKSNKDIKVAYNKTGLNTVKDLMKNDTDFKNNVTNLINQTNSLGFTEEQRKLLNNAKKSIAKDKIDKKVYDTINLLLVDNSKNANSVKTTLYKELKKKGYGAISDVNDKYYSGYLSKNPVILFDTGKLAVDNVRQIPYYEINKDNIKANKKIVNDTLLSMYGGALAVSGSAIVAKKSVSKQYNSNINNKKVAKYRKEHPDTTMSYYEILETLNK